MVEERSNDNDRTMKPRGFMTTIHHRPALVQAKQCSSKVTLQEVVGSFSGEWHVAGGEWKAFESQGLALIPRARPWSSTIQMKQSRSSKVF